MGLLTNSGRLYGVKFPDAAECGGGMGDGWAPPRLNDRSRAGRLVKDHLAGVIAEPSRIPISNLFWHPSSVCLRRVSLRAKRLPQS